VKSLLQVEPQETPSALPDYSILATLEMPGWRKAASVRLLSYEIGMPVAEIEQAARRIAQHEGFSFVTLYQKREASASYEHEPPNRTERMEKGFLGLLNEGGVFWSAQAVSSSPYLSTTHF
jgi:hypothetical protein